MGRCHRLRYPRGHRRLVQGGPLSSSYIRHGLVPAPLVHREPRRIPGGLHRGNVVRVPPPVGARRAPRFVLLGPGPLPGYGRRERDLSMKIGLSEEVPSFIPDWMLEPDDDPMREPIVVPVKEPAEPDKEPVPA